MTISDIKNILNRKFRGANIDEVQGISDYTVFEEAASNLLSEIDPYETVRTSEINLFNDIFDYSAPSDLKGKKILDIRPQANRSSAEDFRQTFTEDFDRDKDITNNFFTVQFDEASKFLRINKSVSNSITVTDLTSSNYTATSGVSNIAEDTILHFGDGKSIRFDVASGANLLTWAGTSVDLSDHTQKSTFFLPIYLPDASIISSIVMRVGSDSSNYYSITGSIQYGSARNGYNIYKFEWNGVSDSGTTDESAIDYVRLAITTTSADTDIRIGKLASKLPAPHEIVYYSNSIFRPTSGSTWLTKPTALTDILNLEHEAQNIFIYECCVIIADDLQRENESMKFYSHLHGDAQKRGLYQQYKEDKPTEKIRPNNRWYELRGRNNPRRV